MKCQKVLLDAQDVIKQQDNLLLYVNRQNASLKDENQRLSDALVKMKNVDDNAVRKEVTAGVGGILVGIITVLLVQGHK